MRKYILVACLVALSSPAFASGRPNHLVVRDAKLACPVIAKAVATEGASADHLFRRFAEKRGYSSDNLALLINLCALHVKAANEAGERAW